MASDTSVIEVGYLQTKEAVKELKQTIVDTLQGTKQVVSFLFSKYALNSNEKQTLGSIPESYKHTEKLLEFILLDEKGKRAKLFLEAISRSNPSLFNHIRCKALNFSEEWLCINWNLKHSLQSHHEHLTENIRDKSDIITKMVAKRLLTIDQKQTLDHKRPYEKIEDVLQITLKFNVTDILKFLDILSVRNGTLCQLIKDHDRYRDAMGQMDSIVTDMVNDMRQKRRQAIQVLGQFPGDPAEIDIVKDADALLKLQGKAVLPRNRLQKHMDNKKHTTLWENGEDEFPLKDVDCLFANDPSSPRVTLVEGNPGSGKTLFLKRWSMQWAKCSDLSGSFIIFIPLRSVHSQSLLDIIFVDLQVMHIKYRPVLEHFLQCAEFQQKLTFLIDGIDEKFHMDGSFDIFRLIQGEICEQSRVIITSRMYQNVIAWVKPLSDSIIILSGITEGSRDNFMKHMLGKTMDKNGIMTFIKKCQENLFDTDILSVPIYLSLLCVLGEDHYLHNSSMTSMNLPKTRYLLYKTFIEIFENRYIADAVIQGGRTKQHLKSSIKTLYFLIGRMSFHSLCRNRYIFSLEDLRNHFIEQNLLQKTGLFIEESDADVTGVTYTFCHKTFQEYFAGLYCANEGFLHTIVPHILVSTGDVGNNLRILAGIENLRKNGKHRPDNEILLKRNGSYRCMQDLLSPLAVTAEFSVGASSQFTKDLFLFSRFACDIHICTTKHSEHKSDVQCYDTYFESFIVYESQDPEVIPFYVDYLINANKTPSHKRQVVTTIYTKAVYQYITKKLDRKSKSEILQKLYGVKDMTGFQSEMEGFINIDMKHHGDVLLSNILCQKVQDQLSFTRHLPEQLTILTDHSSEISQLVLDTIDFLECKLETFEKFTDILEQLENLRHLGFPFCHLQTSHLNLIFKALQRISSLEGLDLRGSNLDNIDDNTWILIQPCLFRLCTHLTIENNLIKLCTLACDSTDTQISIEEAFTSSLLPFIGQGQILTHLRVRNSVLMDMLSHDKWQILLEKLSLCSNLVHLQLSNCQLHKDFIFIVLLKVIEKLSVECLDLSHNELTSMSNGVWKKFLQALSKCTKLVSLNFSKCELHTPDHFKTFCRFLCQKKELERLDLGQNNFSGLECVTLVESLGKLDLLRYLDLSCCQIGKEHISGLCKSISKMSYLEWLDLSKEPLGKIDETTWNKVITDLQKCTQLKTLNLSGCYLEQSYHIEGISRLFPFLSQLKSLNISKNCFSLVGQTSWTSFCESLGKCSEVVKLNLTNCQLCDDFHIDGLISVVQNLQKLSDISISKNDLSHLKSATWDDFVAALCQCEITSLVFRNCNIPSNPLQVFGGMGFHQIEHLELPHNSLGSKPRHILENFMKALKACSGLHYLKLSKNNLTENCITDLATSLQHLPKLQHLNLDDNNFSNAKASQWKGFLDSISNCKYLKKLALSKCHMNKEFHVSLLGDTIQMLKCLEHLDISSNNLSYISETAWLDFTKGLKNCSVLDKLNIASCRLSSEFHFTELSVAITGLVYLKRLNMSNNSCKDITKDCWKGLVNAIRACKRLQKLNLRNCGLVSDHHLESLGPILETLPRLLHLSLSQNSMAKMDQKTKSEFFIHVSNCILLKHFDFQHPRIRKDSYVWNASSGPFIEHLQKKLNEDKSVN